MKSKLKISFILITIFVISASFAANTFAQYSKGTKQVGYHLLNKIEVGGEGGWDALIADPDAHRLYVSHATKVVVIDRDSGESVDLDRSNRSLDLLARSGIVIEAPSGDVDGGMHGWDLRLNSHEKR